jgi:N-acetylglucosamine malate deacetylase 1
MNKSVLVLAAHPDDEVLGCGGALQHYRQLGYSTFVVIITDGSSTQYPGNTKIAKKKDKECQAANALLDVKKVIRLSFPDMKLDTVPHVELNQALENVLEDVQPTIVFTHSPHDLNKDHRVIFDSTWVVTRPGKTYLQKVFTYEVLSSSEWSWQQPFIPNSFLNIEPYLSKKQAALECYQTEIRPYPHSRSSEGVEYLARFRGLQAGYPLAEAFCLVRDYSHT